MSLIAWYDRYNVNVREIDSQHRELVDLVNELHEAVKAHSDPEVLGAHMKGLLAATEKHFATEEALMIQYRYPGYAIHKSQHDDLLKQLRDYAQEVSGMPHSVFRFSFDISTDWLMKHVQESDTKLGKFLNGKHVF